MSKIVYEEIKTKEKMATDDEMREGLDNLLTSLEFMIRECGADEKRTMKVKQEIVTDIFIPAIKQAYEDAVYYILWGNYSRRQRPINYRHYAPVEREYDYGDEGENSEETEDED